MKPLILVIAFILFLLIQISICINWSGKIVFEDNFNGNNLDSSKWEVQVGDSELYGGRTLNYYTPGSQNIKVENGLLKITSRVERHKQWRYTSGRVIQKSGKTWGAYVARAKMPRGKHLWPAIWLFNMPPNNKCRYEEIDIAEFRGQDPKGIETAAHYGRRWDLLKSAGKYTKNLPWDLSAGFHEYAVLWIPGKIEWYINDLKVYELSLTNGLNPPDWKGNKYQDPCGTGRPFCEPGKFILNTAVGGSFFGKEWGNLTENEARRWRNPVFEIDWVRIYQE